MMTPGWLRLKGPAALQLLWPFAAWRDVNYCRAAPRKVHASQDTRGVPRGKVEGAAVVSSVVQPRSRVLEERHG